MIGDWSKVPNFLFPNLNAFKASGAAGPGRKAREALELDVAPLDPIAINHYGAGQRFAPLPLASLDVLSGFRLRSNSRVFVAAKVDLVALIVNRPFGPIIPVSLFHPILMARLIGKAKSNRPWQRCRRTCARASARPAQWSADDVAAGQELE